MATTKRNISRRVRFSYATSTVSMTLVLFLLGAIGFIMANIFTTTKRMRESVTMIVELKENLSEAERDTVAVRLAESEMVASLKFVSKAEKLADEEFKRVFAVDIEGILGENPLPDTYDVTLSALSSNKEGLEKFAEEARKIEGVAYVPERIVIRRIFTRNNCKKKRTNAQHTHAIPSDMSRCSSTHATKAVPPSCDFKPLKRAK